MSENRVCFRRGNRNNEFYTNVVKSVEKAKEKYCNEKCEGCPFEVGSYCLLNVLYCEFEEYGEKKQTIKKKLIDCTSTDLKNIVDDITSDFDGLYNEYNSGKEIIEKLQKVVDKLKNLEVEVVVDTSEEE